MFEMKIRVDIIGIYKSVGNVPVDIFLKEQGIIVNKIEFIPIGDCAICDIEKTDVA